MESTAKRYWLGAFERPIFKDWAWWHGIAWAVGSAISTIAEPIEGSTWPTWLDAIGVAAVAFFFTGWPVAGLRRLYRSWRLRSKTETRPIDATGSTPSAQTGAARLAPAPPPPPPPPAPAPPVRKSKPFPPPTAAPVPLATFAGSGVQQAPALGEARTRLPYPIARAARAVQMTDDPIEQYQHLLDLGEAMSIAVGILSTSWLRSHDPRNPVLQALHETFLTQGVSQGHWHLVAKAAEKSMAMNGTGIGGFVEGVRSRKGDQGLVESLKTVLEERNRWAHGARPHNRSEAAVRNAELLPVLEHAVERAAFLAESPWVLVEGVSFRRKDQRWNARLRRAMGDHPEFDAVTEIVETPLANDTFYVMSDPVPLDLTPMLVIRYCNQCRQPEVCYADKVDEKAGVSLKSFARGHQVFDQELVHEMATLVPGGPDQATSETGA